MYASERRTALARKLRADGRVSVPDAAREFGVSGETVRRDLAALERHGVARRVHGGAVARTSVQAVELDLVERETRQAGQKQAIAESTKAACDYGAILANYDYSKDLDGYIASMKAGATGDYLKEFSDASDALKGAMVQAQVKSTGEDVQCAYISGSTDDVKAMVTMTQYRTNFTQTQPDRMMFAIEMSLERSGDKWLVSKLDSPLLKNGGGEAAGGTAPGQPVPAPAPAPVPTPGN